MNEIDLLKKYTSKEFVFLTPRGNKSILLALNIARSLGFNKVLIQDQGGWITYLQYPEKLGMQLIKLKTDFGIIQPNELSKNLDKDSVLLVNSLSGYFAEQPMALLSAICKQKDAFLINDASGSIGTPNATFGDIIIGSFGEGKPVNLEYGGFIAFNDPQFKDKVSLEDLFDKEKINDLRKNLESLPERLSWFDKAQKKIKKDLSDLDILHRESKGINIIIRFKNNIERERIINYCNEQNYEWTECPRYIRVNSPAISIEVKRL